MNRMQRNPQSAVLATDGIETESPTSIGQFCRLCGCEHRGADFVATERMYASQQRFNYFECVGCGTVQITRLPDDLAAHYPAHYYSYQAGTSDEPPTVGLRSWLRRSRSMNRLGRATVLGRLASSLAPDYFSHSWEWFRRARVRIDSPILDVGCGQGKLLRELRQNGFTALYGADPFIPAAVAEPGLTIYDQAIGEIDGRFDLIMFHHSLEHVNDPVASLQAAWQRLNAGGVLLVRLPVAGTWAWRHYGADWVQLDAPRHLVLPTVDALKQAAGTIGFSCDGVVFDSDGFQFWGSELYRRGMPLFLSDGRPILSTEKVFSDDEMAAFQRRGVELNERLDGDQACFYFSKL